MQGYLHKKGRGQAKIWRKRYCLFVAESQLFEVYKSVGAPQPDIAPAKIAAVYNVPNREKRR